MPYLAQNPTAVPSIAANPTRHVVGTFGSSELPAAEVIGVPDQKAIPHFGEHLMIDGYGGGEQLLDDPAIVRSCLSTLPGLLGMSILSEPSVYRAEPNHLKDPGGWTGMVVLVESHISLHTFPKRGFVSADVYTCKNGMDREVITAFVSDRFQLADIEIQFVVRGRHYPERNIY